jgi:hypothetical protein
MIDSLKRQLVQFRTLAMDFYDKLAASPDEIRNKLATVVDNRGERQNPVRMDEDFFFPVVHGWEDQAATIEGLDKIEFVVPMKGYDAFLPYNAVNIDRPDTVARLERLVPRLVPAFFEMQTRLIMNVFRKNPLCYDGQNFFDTDHSHPGGKGAYSNVLTPTFAAAGNPTIDEAKALLHEVQGRLVQNLAIEAEVVNGDQVAKMLTVIVHNVAHWSKFNLVRTQEKFEDNSNEFRGTFSLLLDRHPTSGQENRIEFQLSELGGPRPAFLVPDKDPVLEAWETNRVPNGYVAIGVKGIFGVKPGFPQGSVQARPNE